MEDLVIVVHNKEYKIHYQSDNHSIIIVDGKQYQIELLKKLSDDVYSFLVNQKIYQVDFDIDKKQMSINLDGFSYDIVLKDATYEILQKYISKNSSSKSIGAGIVKAPMPGLVVKIFVEPDMPVIAGDKLLIVEAMKMENLLKSTINGTVKEVKIQEGSTVDKDTVLIIIEPS